MLPVYNNIERMADADEDIDFGKSIFKGKSGLDVDFHRWCIQLAALVIKNVLVLMRKPLQLLIFLLLPASIIFVFLLEKGDGTNSQFENLPPVAVDDIGECHHSCTHIVYSPKSTKTDTIMEKVAMSNHLKYGKDVVGFLSTESAKSFVASNLGKVSFTVFFRDDALWSTSAMPTADTDHTSYTIFYNASTSSSKESEKYNVDIPILTLQKSIDHAVMAYLRGDDDDEIRYNVKYGQLWAVPSSLEAVQSNTTTMCDRHARNLQTVSSLLPYLLTFCFMLMANISFQLIVDERGKQLFAYLRRLGLMDSAYWLSWAIVFQAMLLLACAIALIVVAGVRLHSPALSDISYGMIFLVLWLSGTGMLANGMFLASLNR